MAQPVFAPKNQANNELNEEEIFEICDNCNKSIPLGEIATHNRSCNGGSSASSFFDKEYATRKINEMFPSIEEATLSLALERSSSLEAAIDYIVSHGSELDLESILSMYKEAHKLNTSNILEILSRENIYRESLSFYKIASAKTSLLKEKLIVVFKEERGIDAGALKIEFFQSFFAEALKELFEEVQGSFIPKRSGGNLTLFKLLGISIAHSILQDGPAFGALPQWCYDLLIEKDDLMALTHLTLEQIPLNAGTAMLKKFISLLLEASDNKSVDEIFDSEEGPAYEQLVNSSQWDILTKVDKANKETLINLLLLEELVHKRERQIKAIREGLKVLDLFKFIKQYPVCFRGYFVNENNAVTGNILIDHIVFKSQEDLKYGNLNEWLKTLVLEFDNVEAQKFLQFCTSYKTIPLIDEISIGIEFADVEDGPFAKATACLQNIKLPIIHENYGEFKKFVLKSLEYESEGFADY